MKRAEIIQNKINALYAETFKEYKGGLGLSVPLIPRVSLGYLKNRTLIIGQETNTWYKKTKDDLKNVFLKDLDNISEVCLDDRFDNFICNCADGYGGKFWDFNRLLYAKDILEGDMIEDDELSHCWMNLFSVEACKDKTDDSGRPSQKKNKELAKKIIEMQGDLLFQSIKILKPKLIVFLTGHSLDQIILDTAICANKVKIKQADPKKILTKEQLSEFQILDKNHPLSSVKIFRSYHPSYFMSRINGYKPLKQELKSNQMDVYNAVYYTDTFIKKLKRTKY
jgi:hypothetical protein